MSYNCCFPSRHSLSLGHLFPRRVRDKKRVAGFFGHLVVRVKTVFWACLMVIHCHVREVCTEQLVGELSADLCSNSDVFG